MLRRRVWFVLALVALAACASSSKPASSVVTLRRPPSSAPVATESQSTVDGLYVEQQSPEPASVFVFSMGDRKWLLGTGLMLELEPAAGGSFIAHVAKDESGVFDPPTRPDAAWRLHGNGARVYVQRRDAIEARLAATSDARTFMRLDSRSVEERAQMQRYMTILRDPNPDRFRQEVVGSIDPSVVAARGGVAGWVAEQLGSMLDDVRPFAADHARIDRDEAILQHVTTKPSAMWPPSEDAALLALVDLRRQSKDTIELRGTRALFHGRDKGDDCWLALLEPDLTDSLPPPDVHLQLTARRFIALQASHGACDFDFDPKHMDGGAGGGVTAFVDPQGTIAGLLVVGYEYGEIYLAPGRVPDEAAAMMRAAADERARQAE